MEEKKIVVNEKNVCGRFYYYPVNDQAMKVLSLTRVSEISAIPIGFFDAVPLKITFSILSLRSILLFCSPRHHLSASTIFVFPHPFGPTIAVMPSLNLISVLLANDLKPNISIPDRYNYYLNLKYCIV